MCFQLGKYYKHTTGYCLHIVGALETTMWGLTLIAETTGNKLIAVGRDEASAVNYSEITKEEWMRYFS